MITAENLEKECYEIAKLLAIKLVDKKLPPVCIDCGCMNIIRSGFDYDLDTKREEVATQLAIQAAGAIQFVKLANKPTFDSTSLILHEPVALSLRLIFIDGDFVPHEMIPIYKSRFRVDIAFYKNRCCE